MLAFWGWRIEKGCFKQCEKEWIYYSILNGLQNYGETWKQTNQKTNRLNLQGQRGLSEGNAASSMIKSPAPEPHHINPRRLPLPTWFQDFAVPAVPWISQRDGSFLAIKTNKTGDWRRDTLRMAAKPTAATTAFARKMHHHQWVYFFQVSHRASDDPNLNPIWNLSAEMSKMYTFYLFSLFRTTGGSSTKKKVEWMLTVYFVPDTVSSQEDLSFNVTIHLNDAHYSQCLTAELMFLLDAQRLWDGAPGRFWLGYIVIACDIGLELHLSLYLNEAGLEQWVILWYFT